MSKQFEKADNARIAAYGESVNTIKNKEQKNK